MALLLSKEGLQFLIIMRSERDLSSEVTPQRLKKLQRVLEKRTRALTIVVENIHDPHNFSAVLRSCDAVGVLDVHLVYHSGQSMPRLATSSSASAKKWVSVHKHDSIADCFSWLRTEQKKIYTTHMTRDAVSLYDLNLSQPVALVFGNEHSGVSEQAHELADGNFLIPQVGMVQSLNISVACAVSLYEAYRQRQKAGLYQTSSLDRQDYQNTLNDWLQR